MRGKVAAIGGIGAAVRITPAYAGKRQQLYRGSTGRGDHPRLCGEKCHQRVTTACKSGSPPPMRGKGCFCGDR